MDFQHLALRLRDAGLFSRYLHLIKVSDRPLAKPFEVGDQALPQQHFLRHERF